MKKRVYENIREFPIPHGVVVECPEVVGGGVELQRAGLGCIHPGALSEMCDNFRATIFERAGVADPEKFTRINHPVRQRLGEKCHDDFKLAVVDKEDLQIVLAFVRRTLQTQIFQPSNFSGAGEKYRKAYGPA